MKSQNSNKKVKKKSKQKSKKSQKKSKSQIKSHEKKSLAENFRVICPSGTEIGTGGTWKQFILQLPGK